jgi:hypothetical protein
VAGKAEKHATIGAKANTCLLDSDDNIICCCGWPGDPATAPHRKSWMAWICTGSSTTHTPAAAAGLLLCRSTWHWSGIQGWAAQACLLYMMDWVEVAQMAWVPTCPLMMSGR